MRHEARRIDLHPNRRGHQSGSYFLLAQVGGYPPLKEIIHVALSTHPSYARDGELINFVRLSSIPERLRKAVHELSIGSAAPAIDEAPDAIYEHDVERFLRALCVQVVFTSA